MASKFIEQTSLAPFVHVVPSFAWSWRGSKTADEAKDMRVVVRSKLRCMVIGFLLKMVLHFGDGF